VSGAPWREMAEEEMAMVQADVDKIYSKFKGAVTSKRPQVKDEDMQGQVFDGEEAFAKGLVDDLVLDVNQAIAMISG